MIHTPVYLPFMVGMAVDVGVQTCLEKQDLDWRRTFTFTVHGVLYVGAAQYFIFNRSVDALPVIPSGW